MSYVQAYEMYTRFSVPAHMWCDMDVRQAEDMLEQLNSDEDLIDRM